MRKYLAFFAITIIFLFSCKIKTKICSVKAGDHVNVNAISVEKESINGLSDYETFGVYHDATGTVIEPSNEIEFQLIKKEKRIKIKRKGEGNGCALGCLWPFSGSGPYAIVRVNKFFYRYRSGCAVFRWILLPFTSGMSLLYLNPHQKKVISKEKCKPGKIDCNGTYNKKILIESQILCKRKTINDTLKIIENLPPSMKVTNHNIKIKRGKRRIDNVIYIEKNINGKKVQLINIVGKNNTFKKHNKIWVIFDVTISPCNNTFSNNISNPGNNAEDKTDANTATISNNPNTTLTNTNIQPAQLNIPAETTTTNNDSLTISTVSDTEKVSGNNQNTTTIEQKKYYIIEGSYINEQKATEAVNQLKSKGFKDAEIVGMNNSGGYRVCYKGYVNKDEALKDLQQIKTSVSPNAWLFEKK